MKVTVSSPPTKATVWGSARTSRSRPPLARHYREEGPPAPGRLVGRGQDVGGPPAQPHERSIQAGQHRAECGRQAHRDDLRSASRHKDQQRPEEIEVHVDGKRPEMVEIGEGPFPVLGDVRC